MTLDRAAQAEQPGAGPGLNLIPPNEPARIAAVRRYDVLDTPPDGSFDRIAGLAAQLLRTPIAIVSVVDTDRVWFKAHHGLEVTEIGRDPGLCASAILGSDPWIVTDAAHDPRTLANPLVAGEFGLRFYAGVPLTTHDGYNLGTLCVIDKQPREITPEETGILSELAGLVVEELELRLNARTAIRNAHVHLQELQQLAGALQSSLLPPSTPTLPFAELAASYHPASKHQVGGDFYDIFPVDGQAWGVVIGDVCGKGPVAAARTSCARYTVRAAAIHEPDPSAVLRLVNAALIADCDDTPESAFVTALFARVEPAPDGVRVRFAVAGHPLPLLLCPDGRIESLGVPGTLLGVLPEISVTDAEVTLHEGEVLTVFTDGVLDSGSPEAIGQHGLEALLRAAAGQPVAALVERVHAVAASAQRDDIAILAFTPKPAG